MVTLISGKHNHETIVNQIRGADRTKLAEKIQSQNNGSCYQAREHDLAIAEDVDSVPSLNTYNKCKAEFKHKGVPTTDWITNLLYIGRSFENCEMDYVQSCDIFPQLCIQLYLDKAISILHNIPEEHRIGFMDSTGKYNIIKLSYLRFI